MPAYDPKFIVAFADDLYSKANRIIATYVIRGVLLGAVFPVIVSGIAMRGQMTWSVMTAIALVGGVPGVLIGWSMGVQKAFMMKLQAQLALCQLQTEINTRQRESMSQVRPSSLASG